MIRGLVWFLSLALSAEAWSILYPLEYVCTQKCKDSGKPFGRLLGTTCSCYCPILNPPANNDPCDDTEGPTCQRFCQFEGYSGGDCAVGGFCWCFCRIKDKYSLVIQSADSVSSSTVTYNYSTTTPAPVSVSPLPPIIAGGAAGIAGVDIGQGDLSLSDPGLGAQALVVERIQDLTNATEGSTNATEGSTNATEDLTNAAADPANSTKDLTITAEDSMIAIEETTSATEDSTDATEDPLNTTEYATSIPSTTTDILEDPTSATVDPAPLASGEFPSEPDQSSSSCNNTNDSTMPSLSFQVDFNLGETEELSTTPENPNYFNLTQNLSTLSEVGDKEVLEQAENLYGSTEWTLNFSTTDVSSPHVTNPFLIVETSTETSVHGHGHASPNSTHFVFGDIVIEISSSTLGPGIQSQSLNWWWIPNRVLANFRKLKDAMFL